MILKKIKEKHEKALLAKKNVVGVGIGLKNGKGELCVLVAVKEKVSISDLNKNDVIPKELEKHFKTDVIAIGELKQLNEWKHEYRPVKLGVSCCWEGLTACSSGLPIYHKEEQYVLMNNHCISADGKAKVGDKVLQPSPSDGGGSEVGEVTEMNFPVSSENEDNIDMSIFKATEEFINEDVAGNKYIPETRFLDEDDLFKNIVGGGRTVGQVARGIAIAVDFTANVWGIENGKEVIRQFKDCVMALNIDADNTERAIVYGGDSSSIRFIDNKPLVQTFAGSEIVAIFNQTAKSLQYAEKVFGKKFTLEKKEEIEVMGYVAYEFLKAERGEWVVNTKYGLRLRKKATTESPIVEVLPYKAKIKTNGNLSYSNGWNWLPVI